MRIKWKDEDGKKEGKGGLCFSFLFPSGIEASRNGFLATRVLYALRAEAQLRSRLPAAWTSTAGGTSTDDSFLHQSAVFTGCGPCGRGVLSLQF